MGWSPESARLFSIDVAMLGSRRLWSSLDTLERRELSDALQEARRLVVDGHVDELGYLQTVLESYLIRSPPALETMIALEADKLSQPLRSMLRQRLRARLFATV